jgi:signal transduction histidine kinase
VAALLMAAGLGTFIALLHRGLNAALDGALQTRAAPVVASLRAPGPLDIPDVVLRTGSSGALDSLTVVFRPNGTILQAEPAGLSAGLIDPSQLITARRHSIISTTTVGREQARLLATPVARADGTWVVLVGASTGVVKETVNETIHQLFITAGLLLILVTVGAWVLAGAALRPVEGMRSDAEKMGEHDVGRRLTVPQTADELEKLAMTFNGLLERLHQSVARQRDLVADAGHELRTPLAVLRTELELADRPGRRHGELVDAIQHARKEVERLSRLADDLLFLARADGAGSFIDPVETDISTVLTEAARANRACAADGQVGLAVTAPEHLFARADPEALRRAIDNLVGNALAATPPGGAVHLEASRSDGKCIQVTVSDTGPGFPPDFLPHAFERFRRADFSRSVATGGSGLGLSIVAAIAAAHGGTVTVANARSGGALVTITLPTDSARP